MLRHINPPRNPLNSPLLKPSCYRAIFLGTLVNIGLTSATIFYILAVIDTITLIIVLLCLLAFLGLPHLDFSALTVLFFQISTSRLFALPLFILPLPLFLQYCSLLFIPQSWIVTPLSTHRRHLAKRYFHSRLECYKQYPSLQSLFTAERSTLSFLQFPS